MKRIFLEGLLIEVPSGQLLANGQRSFGKLVNTPENRTFDSFGALLVVGENFAMDITAEENRQQPNSDTPRGFITRIESTPRQGASDSVLIHVTVDVQWDGVNHSLSANLDAQKNDTVLIETALPAKDGRRVVLMLQPTMIQNDDDWKRVLEEKLRNSSMAPPRQSRRGFGQRGSRRNHKLGFCSSGRQSGMAGVPENGFGAWRSPGPNPASGG